MGFLSTLILLAKVSGILVHAGDSGLVLSLCMLVAVGVGCRDGPVTPHVGTGNVQGKVYGYFPL